MYAMVISINNGQPKHTRLLLEQIKRLRKFIVTARRTKSRRVFILPAAALGPLEHALDMQTRDCTVQLLRYPNDMYHSALRRAKATGRELTRREQARLMLTCLKRASPNAAERVTRICEPCTPEYDRLKRIIHNLD